MSTTSPNIPGQQWSYGLGTYVPCDHCFCIKAAEEGTDVSHRAVGPHRQCCKCWTVMAEEFVK